MLQHYLIGAKAKLVSRIKGGYKISHFFSCDTEFYRNMYISNMVKSDYPVLLYSSHIYGDVRIGRGSKLWNCVIEATGKCNIGMCSSLNDVKIRQGVNPVKIGNYCSIGEGTRIIEFNHRINRLSSYYYHSNIFGESLNNDIESKGEVCIEDDVWIGANCLILSGVTIGRGAVIGAGSVVSRDVDSYSINVGNPIKKKRMRFENNIIDEIEKTKWYLMSPENLKLRRDLFSRFDGTKVD